MLVQTKASCYIDALELGLGAPADEIAAAYKEIIPDHDDDKDPYHPSIVNMILLEKFGIGVTEIDATPLGDEGQPYEAQENIIGTIASWFRRPGFRAVITGLNDDDVEHANGYQNGVFLDPASGLGLEEPSVRFRSIWVMGLPDAPKVLEEDVDHDDQTESED